MAKSRRETKKLSDALKKSSKQESRKDRGMQSEYLQAEYLGPGSEPHLSEIQIFDEVHTDIPKLREVGGVETFFVDSVSDVEEYTISSPNFQDYENIHIRIEGELSEEQDVVFRVNGVTSSSYRWFQWWDGNTSGTDSNTSTSFHTAHWAASVRNSLEFTIFRPYANSFAYQGMGYDSEAAAEVITNFAGDPAPAGDFGTGVNSLTFLAATGVTITFYQITISGDRPLQPGDQLLCLRTKLIPLTIVGVLDGRTI